MIGVAGSLAAALAAGRVQTSRRGPVSPATGGWGISALNPSPYDPFLIDQAQKARFTGTPWQLFRELLSTSA